MWPSRADKIVRESPDPVYRQIAADIAEQIKSGELAPGSRLPADTELAAIYGVSRVTARRAIAVLRADGAVLVAQGKGTFVAR